MVDMSTESAWEDPVQILSFFAEELLQGRVCLVLGAGTSMAYGFPSWTELVNRILTKINQPLLTDGEDPTIRISYIRSGFFSSEEEFSKVVHEALYRDVHYDFSKLQSQPMLAAVGALVMASQRGNVSSLINFNFDDLIEWYLGFFGFSARAVWQDKHWSSRADVTIFHPHGFIRRAEVDWESRLVFDRDDMLSIGRNDDRNIWRISLLSVLRRQSGIHIGISGLDNHYQGLIQDLSETHACQNSRSLKHGIRFELAEELKKPERQAMSKVLSRWGLATVAIKEYSEIPIFLFKICQLAAEKRARGLTGIV